MAGYQSTPATTGAVDPGEAKVEEIHSEGVVQVEHPEQFLMATVEPRSAADELHVTGVVAPDVNRAVPVLSLAPAGARLTHPSETRR